jgi:DNA polymerase-3 subunit epsilon
LRLGGGVMSWADGPLCGISIKTTGEDDETARIVAAGMVFIGSTVPRDNLNLLIDPGVPIPAGVSARHGITTERVRAEGTAPSQALDIILRGLAGWWSGPQPVIGYGIGSTLAVLDREMRRHLGRGLAVTGPVVDPHVIDLAVDCRDGPRSLEEDCRYYRVRHDGPHDPVQDALAAARLAWKLARRYPGKVGRKPLLELYQQQMDWGRQQAARDAGFTGTDSKSLDHLWPLRPCSWVNPKWDQTVIDVIHRKILTDWETRLRADGPGLFRTELHIVNDTRDRDPYFTSVRALPVRAGYNDGLITALMGCLASAKAADRVVIAWEPASLRIATQDRDTPLPEEHALKILDVVVGVPTRLSTHPYTPPARPPGTTPFSWGTATVIDDPAKLPPVIEAMIEASRQPDPAPEDEIAQRYRFQKMEFDISTVPRPR